jgi:ferric iron reductase protein FhuF
MTTPNDPVQPSSLAAFLEAVNGKRGDLDAWLEVNDEAEVRAHILAALSTLPQALPLIAEIADAIARNDIITGSPGPLYSMGWSDANKHAARFIRERFGITPPEGASE